MKRRKTQLLKTQDHEQSPDKKFQFWAEPRWENLSWMPFHQCTQHAAIYVYYICVYIYTSAHAEQQLQGQGVDEGERDCRGWRMRWMKRERGRRCKARECWVEEAFSVNTS